jgi:DNA-binding transcriptional MerR regulator
VTAAGLPSSGSAGASLSIGSVLDELRAEFPEITISKIRFLESEGLISPSRTPAGYRQFSRADVTRLRFVLSAQRDHYLPLKVIRAKLEEFDRAPTDEGPTLDTGGPGGPGGGDPPARVRPLTSVGTPDEDPDGLATGPSRDSVGREVLLDEDGVDATLLEGLEAHGILRADASGRYEPEAVVIVRTAAPHARLGVEPRLLRSARASADREAGLLAQLVTPVARSRAPEAARRAEELSSELATLSGRLHALLVGTGLRHGLRR